MTKQIQNYLKWFDNAADEKLDDMRSYSPRRQAYRKSLEAVEETASVHEVDELGKFILYSIDDGRPPDVHWVRRRGLGICARNGYEVSAASYLAR